MFHLVWSSFEAHLKWRRRSLPCPSDIGRERGGWTCKLWLPRMWPFWLKFAWFVCYCSLERLFSASKKYYSILIYRFIVVPPISRSPTSFSRCSPRLTSSSCPSSLTTHFVPPSLLQCRQFHLTPPHLQSPRWTSPPQGPLPALPLQPPLFSLAYQVGPLNLRPPTQLVVNNHTNFTMKEYDDQGNLCFWTTNTARASSTVIC
jgi:hypothetical protein